MAGIVAEIGCNHMGDMEVACEMVRVAVKECGVDVVKFQKRHPRECLTREQYDRPHDTPCNAFGDSYGLHREFLEFTSEQHSELKRYAESCGAVYSTSVWDMTSAKEICQLRPQMIKIASATNLHFDILDYLCSHFDGQIHISTGMTTREEVERIVAFAESRQRARDVVLYSCTSGYPVASEDICLLEITRYCELYGRRVGGIGFSGHHTGMVADIAAIALGAQWVERHFTLNKAWKGTDHAASLEPQEMKQLVEDARELSKALTYKTQDILPVEQRQRRKLKWESHDAS